MFIHIASAKALLNNHILVGAQNISPNVAGAFTGEVCAEQIKDFGLEWCIIGHSERRNLLNENIEMIAKKVERAQESGLHSIICIGENL